MRLPLSHGVHSLTHEIARRWTRPIPRDSGAPMVAAEPLNHPGSYRYIQGHPTYADHFCSRLPGNSSYGDFQPGTLASRSSQAAMLGYEAVRSIPVSSIG